MRLQRRRSDHLAERLITPARGVAVVALVATITLGASQFRDYRAVKIDSPSYAGVENPPAPERQALPRARPTA